MKNLIIALIFLSFKTYSQEIQKPLKVEKNDEIFIGVEQQAEFPGGPRGFGAFLQKKLKYPKKLQRANLKNVSSLVVYVQFVVYEDGSVSDFEILKSVGYGCDEEATRVLKLTSGMWKPGKKDDVPVRSRFTQPITFVISE